MLALYSVLNDAILLYAREEIKAPGLVSKEGQRCHY
jgi:hypothetical protein